MLKLFTQFHVAISLLGILAGFVVVFGMLTGDAMDGWTAFFLAMTIATSVTGFMFPFQKLLPLLVMIGCVAVFVLIVQSFQKIPALKKLAPTQTETPFKIAQGVALLAFIGLGIQAVVALN